jgi:hypothetical protein
VRRELLRFIHDENRAGIDRPRICAIASISSTPACMSGS